MSAAYAMISYWTAYMKTHYPVEFMAAQLTVEAGDQEEVQANVIECRRLGIKILAPDINKSKLGYSIEYITETDEQGNQRTVKAIRFGLKSIKGIGDGVIEEIMKRPPREGEPESLGTPYRDFDDFFNRIDKRKCNKGYIEKLIESGCFDFDVTNRYQLLNHFYFNLRKDKAFIGRLEDFQKGKKAKKLKATDSFQYSPSGYNEDVIPNLEGEYFGFYLTHHPYEDLPYTNWQDVRFEETIDMGGKILNVKKTKTRAKGEDMCFLELDTAGGKIDITVFPRVYNQYQAELFKGNIAIFHGKKEQDWKDPDKSNMVLDKILKAKQKKFKVEKPPELAELAERAKKSKGGKVQMTLDDLGGASKKASPFDALPGFDMDDDPNIPLDGGNSEREEFIGQYDKAVHGFAEQAATKEPEDELAELAKLFE